MKIQVLGSGCTTCHKLYELTLQSVKELGLNYDVEYITDIQKIIEMGVMQSPVLVVNSQPLIVGYLPKIDAIKDALNSQKEHCNKESCSCGHKCC